MSQPRTHRGFAVKVPESVKEDDVKFVTLGGFRDLAIKLVNDPVSFGSARDQIEFVKEAIQALKMTEFSLAKQIDGSIPTSPEIVNFVESTLKYLSGEDRRLPIILWADLLDLIPESFTDIPTNRRRQLMDAYKYILDLPVTELVTLWVSQPGGIYDLALVMDLVFSPKDPDAKPIQFN